jgi:hypothetical protein
MPSSRIVALVPPAPRLAWAPAVLAALIAALPLAAGAERVTFCCTDEAGRRVCGDILPQACYGRAYREINALGSTVRQVEAPMTQEQRAQREAEARRKREMERAAAEERRRNQGLLDAYSSEQDIDYVRDRALADIEAGLRQAQERHASAAKRQKDLAEEMEFYRKKSPPKELADAVRENEGELRAHRSVIEAKEKDMEATRAKYEDEKRRYIELTRGGKGAAAEVPSDTRAR